MLGLAESEASGVLNPTSTAALISGIICLCLVTTAADAARQIHVAQVFARCLDDRGGKKQETKLMASMVKSCEGKHRCRAVWRFTEPQNCPTDKKRLVTTIQCGTERKDITSTGSHTIVCTRRRFTIDGK
jgi:hypothetical protein